ncbi:MAG: restriction endonuclease subunit S [Flavobacteriales bacterium]|nr:restriction endonuclease subunit S [Flavobacteriales bacterium]
MDDVEWGEFNLEELFGKSTRGKRLKSLDRISGSLPFVTAGEKDEGISAYIGNEVTVFSENTTTIDMFGSAKYRSYKYGADDHVAVVHTETLPKSAAIFVTSAIHKSSHSGQFDYSRNFYAKDADELNISLPTKNGKIDFEFMESFIAELEAERIAELEAYLSATGLKDYHLTPKEQAALDTFDTVAWDIFKIEDVLDWQQKTIELDPLKLNSLSVSKEKMYPFYGQSTTNNGIIEYRHLKDDVLNNKQGKSTILIHSNNQNIVYLDTPFYLKDGHGATSVLQAEHLDKMTAQFFMGSIKKVILQKYSYNAKATKIELKNSEISLPIQVDSTPDYDYMTLLISAVQKLVIKGVVNYADKKIAAHNEVIGTK